jgi:prefoldin subunit 5
MGREKPLRELKRDVADAIDRVRRNGEELRAIEQTLQSNLKRLKELRRKNPEI